MRARRLQARQIKTHQNHSLRGVCHEALACSRLGRGHREFHRFYSALFAAPPAVVKHDYAKWMLDDPRVNFAISTRGRQPGLDHLGIQVESQDELQEVYARLREAGGDVIEQGQTTCCYAKSENRGSTIRRASRGKRFSPRGRTQTTATGAASAARRWRMKRRAAFRRPLTASSSNGIGLLHL